MADSSIKRSVITSSSDTLIPPSDFNTAEQLVILQNPGKCDLLAIIHHKEFYRTQDRSYLDNGIFCARKAAEICPPEHPRRKKFLFRLGNFLASRCDRYGETEGLQEALEVLRECLKKDEHDLEEPRRASALECRARCHRLLYLENGSESDFDATLEANKMAKEIYNSLESDKKLAITDRALAVLYEDRHRKNKDSIEYLDQAIERAKYAVWSSKHFDFWEDYVSSMSSLYESRYVAAVAEQDEDVLRQAIDIWEDLFVGKTTQRQQAAYQLEVGRAYFYLTKITESADDGCEASSNIRSALRSTPNNDPARPERMKLWKECVDFLSDTVGFDVRGKVTNAEIKAAKQGIRNPNADEGSSAAKAKLLEDLAFKYDARYQSGGVTSEAIAAINALAESIQLTPEDEYETRVHRLRTIAFFYRDLYRETFNPNYLDQGLPWVRKAVSVCEENPENIGISLRSLTMHTLARMISDKIDEDCPDDRAMMLEAVEYGKKAVDLISEACDGSDNCEHCDDRKMFSKDVESFQRIYDHASGTALSTD
ncbi:hypothetical protein FQN54_000382 [Arachnomyces sp. PD_36]|nr:hypothetical protein FQN54_000382 [Arachnomyces sp. PD_36]